MHVVRLCFLTLMLFSASSSVAQPEPSPTDLLLRVRSRLLADMSRQPRYTCVQNIIRRAYSSDSKGAKTCTEIIARRTERKHDLPLTSWDHLLLDVAIADNREIHSWPGAPKFAEDEIRELAGNGGPFGSGDFAAFVGGVFVDSATVTFVSSRTVKGRRLFEYTFDVSQNASNYGIANGGTTTATAYAGTFLLDPKTADVVELTVRTGELPVDVSACQAISKIEYDRLDIHGHGVLVPHETELRVVYRDGGETSGLTSYSSCREFNGRAVLRLDTTEDPENTAPHLKEPNPPATPLNPLPMDLAFDCRIVTPIDSETPAGRTIEALLLSPIRGQDGAILVPRGAHIEGRLVHLGEHKGKRDYFEVGVRLDSIEVNGAKLPLYANFARQSEPPTIGSASGNHEAQFSDLLTLPRNIGVFFFTGKRLQVHQWDSAWLTTFPESSKQSQAEMPVKTSRQVSDVDAAQRFTLAIRYSQQATDLLNATAAKVDLADNPRLPDILAYRRKAIEVGGSVDRDVLNNLYPGLGDRFRDHFLVALTLFVHGWETRSGSEGAAREELSRSTLLSDEWNNWYAANRRNIEAVLNLEPGTT
jgi:hypothetical protein